MEHERCVPCGFVGGSYDDASLLSAIAELGSRWQALIGSAGVELRERPEPEAWSAIEYVAHSRDITALHVFGLEGGLRGSTHHAFRSGWIHWEVWRGGTVVKVGYVADCGVGEAGVADADD
jgi:hypothetical protein